MEKGRGRDGKERRGERVIGRAERSTSIFYISTRPAINEDDDDGDNDDNKLKIGLCLISQA